MLVVYLSDANGTFQSLFESLQQKRNIFNHTGLWAKKRLENRTKHPYTEFKIAFDVNIFSAIKPL